MCILPPSTSQLVLATFQVLSSHTIGQCSLVQSPLFPPFSSGFLTFIPILTTFFNGSFYLPLFWSLKNQASFLSKCQVSFFGQVNNYLLFQLLFEISYCSLYHAFLSLWIFSSFELSFPSHVTYVSVFSTKFCTLMDKDSVLVISLILAPSTVTGP